MPEIRIERGSFNFEQKPTLVIVRQELSKAGHRYFMFLSEEGCEYLKDYLEARVREGEEISTDSAVVTPKLKPFIRARNIGDLGQSCNKNSWLQMATIRAQILLRHAADARRVKRIRDKRLQAVLDGTQRRHRKPLHNKQTQTPRRCY